MPKSANMFSTFASLALATETFIVEESPSIVIIWKKHFGDVWSSLAS